LAHLVENSHDDALGAEEGISTILAWFPVGEDLKIDAVCGPAYKSKYTAVPDLALPGLALKLLSEGGTNLLQAG